MTEYMTIDQVVAAAQNDVTRQLENGTMKKESEQCTENDENIYTITSMYSQWAENEVEAEQAIWTMFKEKFSNLLN